MSYNGAGLSAGAQTQTAARPARLLKRWREHRYVLITLACGVLGVIAIYASTQAHELLGYILPVFVGLGAILVLAAVRNWEFGLKALLVLVIVEGAVRKWFLPSASEMVYFYKDVIMLAVLVGYLRQKRRPPLVIKRHLKMASAAIGIFALYAIIAMAMPEGPHVLVGFLGLKAYCLYVPLAFIVPRAFPDKEKLVGFLKWYSIIVLPVAIVGAMQFFDASQTSNINRYAVNEELTGRRADVATFYTSTGENFVRVTGTFSYVSGLSVYLPIMFALLLGLSTLYSMRRQSRTIRALYYMALGAVVVTSFMTGSRSSVLTIAIIATLFYCFASRQNLFRRLQQVFIIALLTYAAFLLLLPQAFDAFYTRALGGEQQVAEGWLRIADAFSLPLDEAMHAGPFGYGIGRTQNGVPALMKRLDISFENDEIPIGYEAEPGRVMLEMGITGFLLYTLMRGLLIVTLLHVCMLIRDHESKVLAIASFAALILPLLLGGAVVSHTQNVYQWFLIGVVIALFNAERLARLAKPPREALAAQVARTQTVA